ncbi:MAG TPA: hypothetical protein VLA52_11900 [Thermohalobaculum sp.]|nr:hypothetical protein [Thermohalobaculum sp.]
MMVAIGMAAAASVRAPPPLDAASAERAVAGAEWLAARAGEQPDRAGGVAADDLTNWLLIAGGADEADGYVAFGAYLAGAGYGDADTAVSRWMDEFPRVLFAHDATRGPGEARPVQEIEADILALPTIALDEAGERARDALFEELILATVSPAEREAVANWAARIEALRALAAAGAAK